MTTKMQQKALQAPQSIGLRSPAFEEGTRIPREHAGVGDDVSPPLEWMGVPKDAQALALVVDDPDAQGGTFTHWTVWNLPPDIASLEAGADVTAIGASEGRNHFGVTGWRGPMPPSGTHRYVFRLFALREEIRVPPNAPAEDVWRALADKTLAWGQLTGTFSR